MSSDTPTGPEAPTNFARDLARDFVGDVTGRRRLVTETLLVLGVSLGASAIWSLLSLLRKLTALGVSADEQLMSAIGPAIAGHIGPGAYGVALVEAEG